MIDLNCQSCGMPMDKPENHGGGDVNNPFCQYCTDEQGNLLPRDQVRAKMIQFYIQKQGKTQEEAERATDQLMGAMPAWKGEGVEAVAPSEPTVPLAEEPRPEETVEPPPGSAPGPTPTEEPTVSEPTKGAAVPGVTPEPSEPQLTTETTPEPTTETPAEQPKTEGETPTE